ncbi:hypothetical protein SASPL_104472 [Salvia splendens]|uniref:CCR4-NOT transcription complex subunit 4 n=1 Tax=Salvia splendens TaxID=180675 RepID=A0A8X9A8G0_SALSN|nr:hypothetical protein SASPL_104472 [Salvia splendens]
MYSKEDEAVRCIQSLQGFGKPLRACFGTTKYCHAWLRNVNTQTGARVSPLNSSSGISAGSLWCFLTDLSPNAYVHPATPPVNKKPHGSCTAKLPANSTNDVNSSLVCVGFDSTGTTNGKIEKIQPSHFIPNHVQENLILDGDAQFVRGAVTSQPPETTAHTSEEVDSTEVQSDFRLETASIVTKNNLSDIEDDILSFENHRLKDPEAIGKVCNYPIGHSETILKTPEVELSFGHEFSNSNSFQLEKLDSLNGFPALNRLESELFADNHSTVTLPYNIIDLLLDFMYHEDLEFEVFLDQSISRPQVLAPPGFSVPSRTPPPGFTSQDRITQIFDGSGNHLDDSSSLLRHSYQTPPLSNTISNGDVEFIDPVILAVGKGLLPGSINNSGLDDVRARYSSQLSTYEEAKFLLILQRSFPSHQNQKFSSMDENLSPLGDAYSISSRVLEKTLANNMSPLSQFSFPQSRNGLISNGQWDGWNELQAGNNFGMSELLRNERLGYNKFYGSYEDSKIRMPSSGSLYNGTYGY